MEKSIQELLKYKIRSRSDLMAKKRRLAKKFGETILTNAQILNTYRKLIAEKKILPNLELENILRKRSIRTLSGIAPVAVLTMPFTCPGKCAYCPTEKDVPQSYLSNEPAVMRAIHCGYDPYKQVQLRLKALIANGHEPEKIELIVIGGTWSVLPEKYKFWYIERCFAAANEFELRITNYESRGKTKKHNSLFVIHDSIEKLKTDLNKAQKKNETTKYKIIGLTLETRPDYINKKEILEMRELGCTRVEIGVQAIDDKILKLNKRGHGVKEIADATKFLKNHGFKTTYHIMPGLPGSTPAKDLAMFKQFFSDERFQPDQLKFYPTVVTKGSLLYRWWKQGRYKPYTTKQLENLIIKCKQVVPEYVRIIRLIRDIPAESIKAGNLVTNLRQVMQQKGAVCRCIRCREARDKKIKSSDIKIKIIQYLSSGGNEYFISAESKNEKTLYGFCRLRLPGVETRHASSLRGMALIRELHVYGELVPVGSAKKIQHTGLGKQLMFQAEKIAIENGYKKMAIISGVGVRGYYKKLGYKLKDTYMVKTLHF